MALTSRIAIRMVSVQPWGSTCNYYHTENHWRVVCRKRLHHQAPVNAVDDNESATDSYSDSDSFQDSFQIHTLDDEHVNLMTTDTWVLKLECNGTRTKFRIDTGAKWNIMVTSDFDKLTKQGKLRESVKVLKSFTNHKIRPVGNSKLLINYKDKAAKIDFEIVDIEQENILSGNTAIQLGLIERILKIDNTQTKEFNDFPDLIKTTGTLPVEYRIELGKGAKRVVHNPMKQPVALKQRIIQKLNEMEENGYIVHNKGT